MSKIQEPKPASASQTKASRKSLFQRVLELMTQSQDSETRSQKEAIQDHACVICFDFLPANAFFSSKTIRNCKHKPSVCLACFNMSIKVQLASRRWNSIKCPVCPVLLPSKVIMESIKDDFIFRQEYKAFLTALKLQHLENFQWCLNSKCHAGQVHKLGKFDAMTCNNCQFKTCVNHGTPWHYGKSCMEVDHSPYELEGQDLEEYQAEIANILMLEQTTKLCPGCGVKIEKNGGCDHMECTQCFLDFDWETLDKGAS